MGLECLTDPYKGELEVTERHKAPTRDSGQGHGLSHFLRLLFRFLMNIKFVTACYIPGRGFRTTCPALLGNRATEVISAKAESSPTATGLDPRLRGGDNHGDFHLLVAAGP